MSKILSINNNFLSVSVNHLSMGKFFGYYVKCQGEHDTVAVIFGKADKSFIQIITDDSSHFVGFKDCYVARRHFEISVGKNHACEKGMTLDMENVSGKIKFGPFTRLRSDIMGPFKWLPFMECRHMIVSMRHKVSGQITINNKVYDLDGIGYIEGDRGKSFPKKYFWTQAHLGDIDISASCAIIPYLGLRFKGTICVVRINNREYRLATYRGARVKRFDRNSLIIKQRKLRLEVEVLDDKKTHPLQAPTRGKMIRTIHESVRHKVRYKFTNGKNLLFEGITERAGYEYSILK